MSTAGGNNLFVGVGAGQSNTTGRYNTFFGQNAGKSNQTGGSNSFFGTSAGRTAVAACCNSFFGTEAGQNATSPFNSFFGFEAGHNTTNGSGNSFFGRDAGFTNTTGSNNTILGANADLGAINLSFATAIGAGATVNTSSTIVLGRSDDEVRVPGTLLVSTLVDSGAFSLCRTVSNKLATCSSSLRYKDHLAPFTSGLELINRLRPITFTWKQGGMRDLGLGAEDVADVEPLLVTHNERGQVEGVKYDRIAVVLINAVREQQETIRKQQAEINELKRLACKANPKARLCR